jgi:hypothetical protein
MLSDSVWRYSLSSIPQCPDVTETYEGKMFETRGGGQFVQVRARSRCSCKDMRSIYESSGSLLPLVCNANSSDLTSLLLTHVLRVCTASTFSRKCSHSLLGVPPRPSHFIDSKTLRHQPVSPYDLYTPHLLCPCRAHARCSS